MSALHVHHTPMRIHSQRADGEPRWCFACRKRVPFTLTIRVPTEPMSYYGPSPSVACEQGHVDGDLFPGGYREWSDD